MNYNKQLELSNELQTIILDTKRSLMVSKLKDRAERIHGKIALASGSRNWNEAIQYNFGKWWFT